MRIEQLLFSQGFGTRRECAALCLAGRVAVAGHVIDAPDAEVADDTPSFTVDGTTWPQRTPAIVMLHKPTGYECSRAPNEHRGVLDLLPAPLRRRGVQPVGRLDVDATGLLLLTDDGALLHRLSSPRKQVAKVYEVTSKHPASDAQLAALRDGVLLRGDTEPVRAAEVERIGTDRLRLTLTQGKYHQVKRMVAAAGNRVEALHRSAFAGLTLPPDLAAGQWSWVDPGALG